MKIVSVKKVENYRKKIYDISVADNHNYMITKNDQIVHNSGKSFILEKTFPEAKISAGDGGNEIYQSGGKWKVINSDHLFVRYLLKVDLPLDIAQKDDPLLYGLQQNIRNKAKKKLALRIIPWLNGMLPIILDGTCKNAEETLKIKQNLEALGYDTYMLFVDTDEEVASRRNAARKRKVPDDFLRKINNQVRANKDIFQKEFGENFFYVNNSIDLKKNPEELKALITSLRKFGNKIENSKINNPIGQNIVKTLKDRGGAYLSDYFSAGEMSSKSNSNISKKDSNGDKTPGFDLNTGFYL